MIVTASQPVVIVRDQLGTDGLPAANTHTATLWKNGVATAVVITPTNPAVGVYGFAWTIPANAAPDDVFSLRVVDGDGYASTVWEGITGSGAGDASQATLLEVQADVNSLLGLSGQGSVLPPGYVSGLSEPLVIADDYISANGRLITISLVDRNGDPAATTFGAKSLADAGISIQALIKTSGASTAVAVMASTCTFIPAPDVDTPASLTFALTKNQTILAAPGSYDLQIEAKWSDTTTLTFLPFGKITFVKDVRRIV